MAVFQCLQRYEERPSYRDCRMITGEVVREQDYPEIIPAKFLVVSSSHKELRDISEWVRSRDIQAVISITDSVDGINHSFTVRIYDKEAIVLLHLIWAQKMFFRYEKIKEKEGITTEEMIEWCKENLTDGEVTVGNIAIFVETETDASAFILRWL